MVDTTDAEVNFLTFQTSVFINELRLYLFLLQSVLARLCTKPRAYHFEKTRGFLMELAASLPFVKFVEFDPKLQYFEPPIYLRADSSVFPCVKRFDSADEFDRRCSMVATNIIVRILNRDVVPDAWKLQGFMDEIDSSRRELDTAAYEAMKPMLDEVYLRNAHELIPSFVFFRETQKNVPLIELIHRTVNVFRTFYPMEATSIQRALDFLKKPQDEIFGVRPGTIVAAVAERTRGDLQRLRFDWEKTMPAVNSASTSKHGQCIAQ